MNSPETFTIRADDGAELVLGPPDPDAFMARLRAPGLNAEVAVFHFGGDFLGKYFADLATNWRGWDGDRDWRSLEGALEFHASISKAGAVLIQVVLRNSADFTWRVTYDFGIENGDLDMLAREAAAFGQLLVATT
jgi:hypothetical protein